MSDKIETNTWQIEITGTRTMWSGRTAKYVEYKLREILGYNGAGMTNLKIKVRKVR